MDPVDDVARMRCLLLVIDAIDHLHDQRIVHADIRPANVLVTGEFAIKLADFGISHYLNAYESVSFTTALDCSNFNSNK